MVSTVQQGLGEHMVERDSWEPWGLPCVAVGPVLGPLSLRGLVFHCAGGRGGRGVL